MNETRTLFDEDRPDIALQRVEALLRDEPDDIELLALRVDCLVAVGQFELAMDAARMVLAREPGHAATTSHLAMLEREMARPRTGPTDPRARSYRSELPRELLVRMQHALHHQTYRGVQCVKSPFDLALYQQIVHAVRPCTILEIGSKAGGSALYFGDLLRNFEIEGRVLSYDIVPVTGVQHPLVTFGFANGRALAESLDAKKIAALPRPLLVIEDADHEAETTTAVLDFFHPLLRPGDWMIVEDGNLSDLYPELYPHYSSGPHRALQQFFREQAEHYRVAAEYCDLYAYNGTTSSNGILERVDAG